MTLSLPFPFPFPPVHSFLEILLNWHPECPPSNSRKHRQRPLPFPSIPRTALRRPPHQQSPMLPSLQKGQVPVRSIIVSCSFLSLSSLGISSPKSAGGNTPYSSLQR